MKKFLSVILIALMLTASLSALSACGSPVSDSIKGIYMISDGVILVSKKPLEVEVFNRYGTLVYDRLTKVTKDDYPSIFARAGAGRMYLLDFSELASLSNEGSYKCRYSVEGESGYIEHTYIISPTPADGPDVYSAEAAEEDGVITLKVQTDPAYARLFKVWTDDVPENERFPASALENISDDAMTKHGEMVYQTQAKQGAQTVFFTRGVYHTYGYKGKEIVKVDNKDYPRFVSSCVCLDLLNPNDKRIAYLGKDTHMQKFTIYPPSESFELANVLGAAAPYVPEPAVFTAELKAEGGRAKLDILPYPEAVYYKAVITEQCGGETKTVCNKKLVGKTSCAVDIRADKEATYRGSAYAVLADGSMTEKLELPGFSTHFTEIPKPEISFENGEIKAVFPIKYNVSVWQSGRDISTDTLVIGIKNTFSYFPDGKGEYGFVYKVKGNGAEILDSPLTQSDKVTVK